MLNKLKSCSLKSITGIINAIKNCPPIPTPVDIVNEIKNCSLVSIRNAIVAISAIIVTGVVTLVVMLTLNVNELTRIKETIESNKKTIDKVEDGVYHNNYKFKNLNKALELRVQTDKRSDAKKYTTPLPMDNEEVARFKEIWPHIKKAAKARGVRPTLAAAVCRTESNFKEDALSKKKAKGLMQVTDLTARHLDMKTNTPISNIYAGVAYLEELKIKYGNNERLVLAAYNAGPSGKDHVDTTDYVKSVKANEQIIKQVVRLNHL